MGIKITNIWSEKGHEPFYAVEIQIRDKLTIKDYEAIVPTVEVLIFKHNIRILLQLVDFHGWMAGAQWEDTKFAAREFNNVDRIAIVGDGSWEIGASTFHKPFSSAEIRYFDTTEIDRARGWIWEKEENAIELVYNHCIS